jgi:hypothetical protein
MIRLLVVGLAALAVAVVSLVVVAAWQSRAPDPDPRWRDLERVDSV